MDLDKNISSDGQKHAKKGIVHNFRTYSWVKNYLVESVLPITYD